MALVSGSMQARKPTDINHAACCTMSCRSLPAGFSFEKSQEPKKQDPNKYSFKPLGLVI